MFSRKKELKKRELAITKNINEGMFRKVDS